MKRLSIFFAALMACTMSFAATKTYTYTFEKAVLKDKGSITLGTVDWTQQLSGKNSVGTYFDTNKDTQKGQQIGTSSKAVSGYSLSTKNIAGTITKVVVNASMANNGGAKLQVSVAGNDYIKQTALTTTATDYTGEGASSGEIVISFTNTAKAFYIKSISVTYTEDEDVVAKPTFTPTVTDFVGSTTITLTIDEGLDIYYTLDGADPTTASTKYAEPFILTSTTTVKAIAYNATTKKASEVAEKTYTKHEPMTCVEVNAAAQDAFVAFKKVTVAYVNGAYNYVKDETGYSLIYSMNYGLKAGQVVEGLQGTMDIFKNLPEVRPTAVLADLTITEGTAPEPELLTVVPTMADINKYVRIENVALPAATWKSSDSQPEPRTLVGKLGEEDITLYNTFKINQAFEVANYNIIGIVTCYNETMQISVISAEKVPVTYLVDVNYDKTMGAVVYGEDKAFTIGEFEEGTKITLTANANEGYKFMSWTVGEETNTENPLTITVTADMTITANFAKDAATAIDDINAEDVVAEKVVRNGQVLIVRDGKTYNVVGKTVE